MLIRGYLATFLILIFSGKFLFSARTSVEEETVSESHEREEKQSLREKLISGLQNGLDVESLRSWWNKYKDDEEVQRGLKGEGISYKTLRTLSPRFLYTIISRVIFPPSCVPWLPTFMLLLVLSNAFLNFGINFDFIKEWFGEIFLILNLYSICSFTYCNCNTFNNPNYLMIALNSTGYRNNETKHKVCLFFLEEMMAQNIDITSERILITHLDDSYSKFFEPHEKAHKAYLEKQWEMNYMVRFFHKIMFDFLLPCVDKYANLKIRRCTPLHLAYLHGDKKIINKIIEHSPNSQSQLGLEICDPKVPPKEALFENKNLSAACFSLLPSIVSVFWGKDIFGKGTKPAEWAL